MRMRATFASLMLTLALAPTAMAEDGWLVDYDEAVKESRRTGKPILADFTGSDWCSWCIKLDDEVFSTRLFKEWADEKVVLLQLDFPRSTEQPDRIKRQNKRLAKKYKVRGFPTVLFLNADGEVLGRSGYKRGGPENWVEIADGVVSAERKPAGTKPAPKAWKGWGTDYQAALALSKKSNKLILANFTGSDWCGWCIRLKREVFSKKAFGEWAAKNVILLELDFPARKKLPAALKAQNKKLQKRYKVRGYPTILFLNAKGKSVGESGYRAGGPKKWTAHADQIIARHAKSAGSEKAPAAAGGWGTDHAAAVAQARKEGKLILANFTGSDWCGWCIRLKREVFSKPAFREWAAQNVVLLELDYPARKKQSETTRAQNKRLQERYKIRGYPTILFLTPDGERAGELGYQRGGPDNWIARAQEIVDRHK